MPTMKVNVAAKKTHKHDTFSTLIPLNYTLKIFGLSCVYRDGSDVTYCSPIWRLLFFIILFFFANIYCICVKLTLDEGDIEFTFKDAIEMAYLLGYIQYVVDAVFVYKYGRQAFIDYIQVYDYIDSILGLPYYEKIKRSIRNMCIFFSIIAVIFIGIDYITWVEISNAYMIGVYLVEYIYLAIRMLGALDIISNTIQLKYRLKVVGDLLENYYSNVENFPGVDKDFIYDKVWICKEDKKFSDRDILKTICDERQNAVLWLSRCYILLIEQCDFINVKFGVRVLLGSTIYFFDMVLMLNLIVRTLMGSLILYNGPRLLIVLSTSMRLVTYSFIMVSGIHRCEQNYRQIERMIRYIDHLLFTKNMSKETRDALKELKDLITTKPIKYHAINFYRVDYATLLSMFSVIVTYTIILLQTLQ